MNFFLEAAKLSVKNKVLSKKDPSKDQGNKDNDENSKKYKTNYNLKESIDITYQKMQKERKEDASLIIPVKFQTFVQSHELYSLLDSILEYCRELFRLENKQRSLEAEAKQRGLPIPKLLPSEKKKAN